MKKELGKIRRAEIGFGGHDDVQIGLTLDFGGDGWGCGTFVGYWIDKSHQVDDKIIDAVKDLLIRSKKKSVSELVGIPVEVTFENGSFASFRVLTEVL